MVYQRYFSAAHLHLELVPFQRLSLQITDEATSLIQTERVEGFGREDPRRYRCANESSQF